MKLAIMQPYLFPYLGYFQLVGAVDEFVIYDDVNYINRGWINRNNILVQGEAQLITLELVGASQNRLINELSVGSNHPKLLKTIKQNYSKAPQFDGVFPLIEEVLGNPERNLAKYLDYGIKRISDYLGLHPKWHTSSALQKAKSLHGQERILAICEELKATHYINPPGGKELYDHENFLRRSMELSFIQAQSVPYRQFGQAFVPNLSIIDVMMFNDREQCAGLLEEYDLV